MSTTRRAFIGVIRTKRALAKVPGSSPSRLSRRALMRLRSIVLIVSTLSTLSVSVGAGRAAASAATALPVVLDVSAVGAGGCELAQLVADHRVGHEHRNVLAAVVHGNRVADHGRNNHRATGPRLDHVVRSLVVLPVHLLHQVVVDKGTLLQAARHGLVSLALLAGAATTDDEGIAGLVLAGATLGLAPGRDRVAPTGGLALATTVRVVDRVHHHTTHGRALALPAHAARLAPVDVRLLGVADTADRRAAADVHVAHLARRHPELSASAFLGDQLRRVAGRAGDLGAAARTQLDAVDRRTDRDVAQRQVVAGLDVGTRAGLDRGTLAQTLGRDDVALLAVGVVQQRDPRGPVRVVLDVRDLGRHAVLVVATEVDDAVRPLVATALVTGGDPALVVAAALLGERAHQRLLRRRPRYLDEVGDRRATTARRGRLVLTDAHEFSVLDLFSISRRLAGQETGPPKMSMRSPSARLTIARLVLARLPIPKRVRRVLPWRLTVLTPVTLTLNTFSTAILISVLLESGRTRKVYLFASRSP